MDVESSGCLYAPWVFWLLDSTGLFSHYGWISFVQIGSLPTVTPALIFSELGTDLSRIYSHLWDWTLAIWIVIAVFLYGLAG
jgi:hypothetical protein